MAMAQVQALPAVDPSVGRISALTMKTERRGLKLVWKFATSQVLTLSPS